MSVPSTAYAAPRPTKYCQACGRVVDAAAVVCPACGVMQADMAAAGLAGGYPVGHPGDYPLGYPAASEKRVLVAFLLCFFFGFVGAHRFYAGRPKTAVLQLLTLGGLGIWVLVDLIVVAVGHFRDGDGERISRWT